MAVFFSESQLEILGLIRYEANVLEAVVLRISRASQSESWADFHRVHKHILSRLQKKGLVRRKWFWSSVWEATYAGMTFQMILDLRKKEVGVVTRMQRPEHDGHEFAARVYFPECLRCNWDGGGAEESQRLRPEVREFALKMEFILRANDFKGGWDSMDRRYLFDCLYKEIRELYQAVFYKKTLDRTAVIKEAVDVANFALMIADVVGEMPWEGRPS